MGIAAHTSTVRTAVTRARTPDGTGRAGAVGLVCASALSLQFGAAVAALLFPRAGALGVVAMRLTFAALIMLPLCRPRVRGHTGADWVAAVGLGLVLGAMNTLIYQAIARIPLGAAVTLELLGPLVLSVVASRRALSLVWAALALTGVYLLGSSGFEELDFAGVGFALAAGTAWVAYIMLNARVGARFPKADGLALAMGVAALFSAPAAVLSAGTALLDPVTLALGAAVAVLSSGVPYTLDLFALRRLPQATFAVLMSLMPVAAAAAGFVVLRQGMEPLEVLAVALVVMASVGAVRTAPRRPQDALPPA